MRCWCPQPPTFSLGTAMKIAHKFSYKNRSNVKVPAVKQCATCDAFICHVGKGSHLKKYCSLCSYKSYLEGAKRYRKNYPENCAQARFRRRTRIKNVRYEVVTEADVITNHGADCHLCGRSIDFSLVWPHPQSKSMDHVIPIAKGGPHILANVKLAHLTCNMRKSDK